MGQQKRPFYDSINMTKHDNEYLTLLSYVIRRGRIKQNRTGDPARAVFGCQMRFDLSDRSIPMLTSKKMFTRGTIVELLDLFIAGTDSIKPIQSQGVSIWDEWADENGSIGQAYGVQWRHWKKYSVVGQEPGGLVHAVVDEIDQLQVLIDKLKNNPLDRRLIVTAWNVADLPEMALPPCHYLFQCYADELTEDERKALGNPDDPATPKYRLSMMLNQRSADVGLGVPFNIVQYSMLLHMIAHVVNMEVGEFIWNGGDVHVYENHVEKLTQQLTNPIHESPKLRFARKIDSIDDFKLEDFIIEGYTPGPLITLPVAV